ncbi:MAG: methylthioribulose 1-phosphate dehydratase [Myxococcota bacterium]|nr:methylthioribulose 1-phosphate dehydratase [Myxococcota bacterium]
MEFSEAAQQIVNAGRWLDARGWAPATSGNYSIRLNSTSIAVTVSGRHKGRLTTDDVIAIDYEGHSSGHSLPSSETPLHVVMYRLDRSVGAVVHTHSVHSTVLGMSPGGRTMLELQGYELLKAFPGISTHDARVAVPIFDNTQDMAALSRRVTEHWRETKCFGYIIRGHGLYTWGSTMEDALRSVETFEFLFACDLERRKLSS